MATSADDIVSVVESTLPIPVGQSMRAGRARGDGDDDCAGVGGDESRASQRDVVVVGRDGGYLSGGMCDPRMKAGMTRCRDVAKDLHLSTTWNCGTRSTVNGTRKFWVSKPASRGNKDLHATPNLRFTVA